MFTVELHCSKTRQHVLTQRDRLKLTGKRLRCIIDKLEAFLPIAAAAAVLSHRKQSWKYVYFRPHWMSDYV